MGDAPAYWPVLTTSITSLSDKLDFLSLKVLLEVTGIVC